MKDITGLECGGNMVEIEAKPAPSLAEAARVWGRIGCLSFGGPAAQIALMHRDMVEERGWLSEKQFLGALSFCMLLPGPEAMQLATYAGWRMHGVRGGLIAGLLFVLPGAAVVLALAMIYAAFGQVPLVAAVFTGVKSAVLVVVIEALLRVAKRALDGAEHWVIAGLAFVAIFFFSLPFPVLILAVGLYGLLTGERSEDAAAPVRIPLGRTIGTVVLWLAIWWGPLLALGLSGAPPILGEIGQFFSKLAVVTFGGAYAVLAYMAQDVVTAKGWLEAGEMLDGLGLAETTPGPLILVTEFTGYLAAFRQGGVWLGLAGAAVTLWATFAPCFLWIFAFSPYVERLSESPRLKSALGAITAAVVGVIGNLSVWFALHVLFGTVTRVAPGPLVLWVPEIASLDWLVLGLMLASGYLLLRRHWGVSAVLGVAGLGGALAGIILPA